jgi:hypothetical protein
MVAVNRTMSNRRRPLRLRGCSEVYFCPECSVAGIVGHDGGRSVYGIPCPAGGDSSWSSEMGTPRGSFVSPEKTIIV